MAILKINSSVQTDASVSRKLVEEVVKTINTSDAKVIDRDLTEGLPLLTQEMVGAFYTPENDRSAEQNKSIEVSEKLVTELQEADTIVIGAPIYNFGIPASLKAYFDLVARVGVTFKYTDEGPVGLLEGKKAYVVIASGGVPMGADWDFASSYLKTVLGFIGISDVTLIDASQLLSGAEAIVEKAKEQISTLATEVA
ncbi:NAD(P)H-dependent oxidoreductase [Limibacter armeniacum]|uniref:FMN-dependent NADH-azoreductase n=1 Tax=Limibacter armeniacum TaxID=466084 RepID=UPI002FE67B78